MLLNRIEPQTRKSKSKWLGGADIILNRVDFRDELSQFLKRRDQSWSFFADFS